MTHKTAHECHFDLFIIIASCGLVNKNCRSAGQKGHKKAPPTEGSADRAWKMSYLVVCGFIQIAQLLGLLDHSGHQHLRQDLIAGELGGEPAAALRDLTDEGGEVGQLC